MFVWGGSSFAVARAGSVPHFDVGGPGGGGSRSDAARHAPDSSPGSSGGKGGRRARKLRAAGRRLARSRRGAITVLGLLIFVVLLAAGGLAVDLMRVENERVRLQATADRASLAAASLTQPFDPEDVVEDYFAKEGLSDNLVDVDVDEGLNFRSVRVETGAVVSPLLSQLIGVAPVDVDPVSAAEERFTEVEVALVLDLSNSMNNFQRIDNLRDAADDFVGVLFANNVDDRISLSVVPYTGQVNVGAALLGQYQTSHAQPWSHCVEFDSDDFDTLEIPTDETFVGTGHFDPWHNSRAPQMFFCPVHPGGTAEVSLHADSDGGLDQRIANMIADGNTSIDVGLKWALALLDPDTRPVFDDLIEDEAIPEEMAGRPLDHGAEGTLKVVVIMTDGENWEEWRLRNAYKVGPSEIWHTVERTPALFNEIMGMVNGTITPDAFQRVRPNNVDMPQLAGSVLSVRRPSDGRFFRPSVSQTNPTRGDWVGRQPSDVDQDDCTFYNDSGRPNLFYDVWVCPDHIVYRMDYAWLWHNFSVRWVAERIYGTSGIRTSSQFVNDALYRVTASSKDDRLFDLCDEARDAGVAVFAVAFEAPANGVNAMRRCATSPNHFYDVDGIEIRDTFRTIAGNILNLRLVQ